MKKLLQSKAGVTVLEGVIALGLLAVITAGSFGVLLSVSRQATQPDMREEMALAVEKANDQLKAMLLFADADLQTMAKDYLPDSFSDTSHSIYALCPDNSSETNPLQVGTDISIECLLPPICDPNSSEFSYKIVSTGSDLPTGMSTEDITPTLYQITYNISCNGYRL